MKLIVFLEIRSNTQNNDSLNIDESYIILPIPYEDFLLLKNRSYNSEDMSLIDIFKLSKIAEKYGFSRDVYTQIGSTRLNKPLVYLIILIITASIGWNYRMAGSTHFKLSWILVLPTLCLLSYVLLKGIEYVIVLANYYVFHIAGSFAIPILFIISLIILIISILTFMSRKSV